MSELTSFEAAVGARVEEMLDACTRCGKCVEACPSVVPAGIADASYSNIIAGILDIVRTGAKVPHIFLNQLVHVILRNALDGC